MAHNYTRIWVMQCLLLVIGSDATIVRKVQRVTGNGQRVTDNGKEGTSTGTKLGFVPTFSFPVP